MKISINRTAASTVPLAIRGGGNGDEDFSKADDGKNKDTNNEGIDAPTTTNNSISSGRSSAAKLGTSSTTKSNGNHVSPPTESNAVNGSKSGLSTKTGLTMHGSCAIAFVALSNEGKPISLQANDNAVNVETTMKLQNSMAGNPNGKKKTHAESVSSSVMDLLFSNKTGVVTGSDTSKVNNVT
jgi:hypothetical protein